MKLTLAVLSAFLMSANAMAATCCNTPTVWTFRNLDSLPVKLTCKLDKSAAWKGDPISMETSKISPRGTFKHEWSREWYSDGMGMIPGTWSCRPSGKPEQESAALVFTTDWGENVTITWNKSKGTVARK